MDARGHRAKFQAQPWGDISGGASHGAWNWSCPGFAGDPGSLLPHASGQLVAFLPSTKLGLSLHTSLLPQQSSNVAHKHDIMPAAGIYYRDLIATPENTETPRNAERSFALSDEATTSHALATADHGLKGESQLDHDAEVKDLGWFEHKDNIAKPLIGGLENETLWLLVRRFNKV